MGRVGRLQWDRPAAGSEAAESATARRASAAHPAEGFAREREDCETIASTRLGE